MSQKFRSLLIIIAAPTLILTGCAQMFSGNLNELVSGTGLPSLSAEAELKNYKFDTLNESTQSLNEIVDQEIVESSDSTIEEPNDFVPSSAIAQDFAPTPATPFKALQANPKEQDENRSTGNPIVQLVTRNPSKLVPAPITPERPSLPQEKIVVGLLPVNQIRKRKNALAQASTHSEDSQHTIVELPILNDTTNFVSNDLETPLPAWLSAPFANHPEFGPLVEVDMPNPNQTTLDTTTQDELDENLKAHLEYVDQLVSETIERKYSEISWSEQLNQTITALQKELSDDSKGESKREIADAIRIMRSLEIMLNSKGENSIANYVELQQSWEHQLNALNTIVENANSNQDWASTAAETLDQLHLATSPLRQAAHLKLAGCCFCRKVSGYGQYENFATTEFTPNQPVLVYCEIENFTPTKTSEDGVEKFRTKISSSFWIKDSSGEVVQDMNYPAVADYARNVRRDFFMHVPVQFTGLQPGDYTLQLRVEDYGSGKTATLTSPLSFRIR